jgi:hypothetical protein
MEAHASRTHAFDALEHGMRPENSGLENQRALRAMIDRATNGRSVEVRIPAGTYEITGEVTVAPEPPASVSITGSEGRTELKQTEPGKNVFVLSSEDEDKPVGKIAIKDLALKLQPPVDDSDADLGGHAPE